MMGTAGQSGITSEVKPIARFLELRKSPVITTMVGVVLERFLEGTTIPQIRVVIFPTFPIGGHGVVGISMNLIMNTMMNWKQIAVRH